MRTAMEKTDTETKTQVLSELAYEPSIKSSHIGVFSVDNHLKVDGY